MSSPECQSQLRVLSLLSASTEIVYRLGCGHLLVGRSHGCDDPPLATTLQIATSPKMDPNAGSKEIDDAVRVQVNEGGPVYHIRNAVVAACKPSVILTQEQCRICAVTEADVLASCTGLPTDTRIVTIKPVTLDDVLGDVMSIANALGVKSRGERLVCHLRSRIQQVAATTRDLAKANGVPKVVHLEWLAPLMGSGYWIAELVAAAGCEMVHGSAGSHSQVIAGLEELREADVIMLAPCGFTIERTHQELNSEALRDSFLQSDAWRSLPAVVAGRAYVADGNKYFNRSSCGVSEAAEIFAETCWEKELCGLYGHHGKLWVRLSELDTFCAREGAPPATKRVEVYKDPRPFKAQRNTSSPLPTAADLAAAVAAAAAAAGAAKSATVAHVHAQIEAMRAGDFELAFRMNSTANQSRLGSAKTFASVVKGNTSFAALAKSTVNDCMVSDAPNFKGASNSNAGEGATCEVDVVVQVEQAEDGPLRFAFQLDSVKGASNEWEWKTDGVKVLC